MENREEFVGYTIQEVGRKGRFCAVFKRVSPVTLYDGDGRAVIHDDEVFDESGLESRIKNLEKGGHDNSFSKEALNALRSHKADYNLG